MMKLSHKKHFGPLLALVICLVAFPLTSCHSMLDVKVSDAALAGISPKGLRALGVTVNMTVDSPCSEITVSDIEGAVHTAEKALGTITADTFTIDAKYSGRVSVKGLITLDQGASAMDVMRLASSSEFRSACLVDLHIKLQQKGRAPVVIRKKNVPLNEFVGMMSK